MYVKNKRRYCYTVQYNCSATPNQIIVRLRLVQCNSNNNMDGGGGSGVSGGSSITVVAVVVVIVVF